MPYRFRYIVLLFMACVLLAQEPLNNEGIIKLVKSGMTEDLIITLVQRQPGAYVFGADDIVALKTANVSEKIIAAMVARAKIGGATGGQPGSALSAAASNLPASISAPGIYYRKGNDYLELLTEDVEWKTSGAMKNIASAGIVKKDLKGALAGPSSRNFLTNPMEIILNPQSGLTVNSYILLPMKPDKGVREFTVGPVNQKSGVAKGAIPFGVEKVGENMFRLVLQTPLASGEYGILTATPMDASTTRGSKMYTFRIL